ACEPRSLVRHLRREVLQRVVRLADAGRRERVCRGDIGARLEVRAMDVADDLRPGQVQKVGVAGDVARVVAEPLAAVRLLPAHLPLNEHAPGTVEDGDPFPENGFKPLHSHHGTGMTVGCPLVAEVHDGATLRAALSAIASDFSFTWIAEARRLFID